MGNDSQAQENGQKKSVCDYPEPLATPFEPEKYMGTWYSIQKTGGMRFDSRFFENTKAEYSNLDMANGTFNIRNSVTIWPTNMGFGVDGTAVFSGCPNGQARVGIRRGPPSFVNYQIMDTDYERYSVVYHCTEAEQFPYLWILSRTPQMDQELLDQLHAFCREKLPKYDFTRLVNDVQKVAN